MSAGAETPPRRGRARRLAGLAGLAVVLSGCTFHFETYQGATTQGHSIGKLFQGFDVTALTVGVFVWILIFWSALRYRRKGPDHWPKQTHHNYKWEYAYTIIPLLIVGALFGYTVVYENSVNRVAPNPPVTMTITGFQWGWRFVYNLPGGQTVQVLSDPTSFGTFELPLNQTTQVNLVSADVIHEFYVPRFNFERYAQSGVTNVFDLTPNTAGTYIGRCDQFCGLHHDLMVFYVKVVQPAQFQSWLLQQEGSGST